MCRLTAPTKNRAYCDLHKQQRGFAVMSGEQRRDLASRGGRAAHALGVAHEWTSNEAKVAGR